MHTANAVPTVAAAADFIPINGAPFQQHQQPQNGRHGHHHVHHHHHQRHHHFQQQQQLQPQQQAEHTSNRFKRKREGSGEPAANDPEGGLLPQSQLESPALRSPWVPPNKGYVTGILG